MESEKTLGQHIEVVDEGPVGQHGINEAKVMGTVKLTEDSIVYIPTPTADPRGSLKRDMLGTAHNSNC